MLNIVAKCLLVSTSLSPVLGAVAINQFERGESWTKCIWWLTVGFLLVALCWGLLRYAAQNAQKHLFDEPFAKFGIGHDIGVAKVMFCW